MTREEKCALCDQVLKLIREQLLDLLPQLGSALAALPWQSDTQRGFRLDGMQVCFCPEDLLGLYAKAPEKLLRGYLHMLLHCLYLHPFFTEHAGEPLWDAACDLAVERIIDELNLPKLGKKPPILPELGGTPLTAEEIYGCLQAQAPNLDCSTYAFDDHGLWKGTPKMGGPSAGRLRCENRFWQAWPHPWCQSGSPGGGPGRGI